MGDRDMITPTQCGDLRLVILKLTCGRKITQDEYRQLCIVINKILSRMEKEEDQDGTI